MLLILAILSAIIVVGSAGVMIAVSRAPEGYEDETGFHQIGSRRGGLAVSQSQVGAEEMVSAGRRFAA